MAHAKEKEKMKRSADRRPGPIFDIDHGRRLHRLRPDLAQRAARAGERAPAASRRVHALDPLWEEATVEVRAAARRRRSRA